MTKSQKFHQQFKRVKRFYERFNKIDKGRIHDMSSANYEDEVYAFFIFCYQLKDWIKNDKTIKLPKNQIEKFVNENDCLSLCADICNGIKHLTRDKERSGLLPEFKNKKISVEYIEGDSYPTIGIKFNISIKTKTIDAFGLATECLKKWEKFIEEKILRNIP